LFVCCKDLLHGVRYSHSSRFSSLIPLQFKLSFFLFQSISSQVILDELHGTAFTAQGLGRTILGSDENIRSLTRDDLKNYISTHYTGNRFVIAGELFLSFLFPLFCEQDGVSVIGFVEKFISRHFIEISTTSDTSTFYFLMYRCRSHRPQAAQRPHGPALRGTGRLEQGRHRAAVRAGQIYGVGQEDPI
jgi:hypothetical protein